MLDQIPKTIKDNDHNNVVNLNPILGFGYKMSCIKNRLH